MKKMQLKAGTWLIVGTLAMILGACSSAAEGDDAPVLEFSGMATATPLPVEVDAATTEGQLQAFELVWEIVNRNYAYEDFNGVDWNEIRKVYRDQIRNGMNDARFHNTMAAMISELDDENTRYLTPTDIEELEAANTNDSRGYIGTLVGLPDDIRDRIVILDVFPNSPADEAGVKPHDTIIAIDGLPVSSNATGEVLERIRGEIGSEVVLTLESKTEGVHDVSVARGPLASGSQPQVRLFGTNDKIGYIFLPPSVNEGATGALVTNGLRALRSEGNIDSLILDLRIARVSSVWPVDELLGLFVHGEAYDVYNATENRIISITGKDVKGSQELPLVVLVGHDTSGVSEVFAGVLQAQGRATIIGGTTRGNVEQLINIPIGEDAILQLANVTSRSLDGNLWGRIGVTPDIKIDLRWEEFSARADPQLDAAIDLLSS